MITSRLAKRHMMKNKKRTALTLLGIILSVAMITAITGFAESARDVVLRSYITGRGDWHISFAGIRDEDVKKLEADPRIESIYTEYGQDIIYARFRLNKPTSKYMETAASIFADNGIPIEAKIMTNREQLMMEGVIRNDLVVTVYSFGGILAAIVVAGSILVISNAFSISVNERIHWFGLLKSAGATREQIRRTVLAEALILAAVAIPSGILAGFFIEYIALAIANGLLSEAINIIDDFDGKLHIVMSLPAILFAITVSFMTIIISAWLPAGKASKISAIDAIKLTREIKIKPRQVKTSRIAGFVFGFEGVLADKSLKRNSGKYRATVISLVTSMVLFITGYSFGEYLGKTTDIVYADYGINASAAIIGKKDADFVKMAEEIKNINNAEARLSYSIDYMGEGLDAVLSNKAQEYALIELVRIHTVTDESFALLCGDFSAGILINKANMAVDGKLADFKPVNFSEGMNLRFETFDKYSIKLAIETDVIPADVVGRFSNKMINIIVAESEFYKYHAEDDRIVATISAVAESSGYFTEKATEIIRGYNAGDKSMAYSISDIEKETRLNKNLTLLVNIFIMGFVILLSLIAVTSVISTISTNMTLRRQEFAILQSVGMTLKDMHKMLNYESLLYGLKSLLYGIPLSVFTSWLFYRALSSSFIFSYILPWKSIIICVAAVLALTASTMSYGAKKLNKGNIADLLKV